VCEVFGLSKRMLFVIGIVVVVVILVVVQNNKNGNAQQGAGNGCQVQVTADVLNVRSGPNSGDKVVKKLATGAIVAATATVQNGFRELPGKQWASSQFLKPVSGPC
jgi:sensor domain CHASE-containing protein